jgi:hypothetical protein
MKSMRNVLLRFSTILPVLQTILYIVLMLCAVEPAHPGINFDRIEPFCSRLALSLNAPAAVGAVLIGIVTGHTDSQFSIWCTGVLVPLLWHAVGLWADRKLGLAPQKRSAGPSTLGRWVSAVILLILVVAIGGIWRHIILNQPGVFGRNPLELSFGLILWPMFFATILATVFLTRARVEL